MINQMLYSKKIKEILDFLNREHGDLFFAVLEREPCHWWNIFCQDFDFYMYDKDYKDSIEAIRVGYPEITIIFAYLKIDKVSIENLKSYKAWEQKNLILVK